MNWKIGLLRVCIVVSILSIGIGILFTYNLAKTDYSKYCDYAQQIKSRSWGLDDPIIGGVPPWDEGQSTRELAAKYREYFFHDIEAGVMWTLLLGLLPWSIYGIGLYLVRGFRTSNKVTSQF